MPAPQYEQAGADIGGTGTTNTIPRWTGATTLGDSGLIDDGTQVYTTTRKVGFGTATPVGRADVAGTSVNQSGWGLLSVQSNDAQGADKGGSITFGGVYDASTATHWAQISGRKENGTSGQYGGYLAFATRTNGAGTNTERARIDSAGNLGLGVTLSAWGSSYRAFQTVGTTLGSNSTNGTYYTQNAFFDGTNWKYVITAAANRYQMLSGVHSWHTAPSGTAGNTITFTQAMTLDASGNVYAGSGTTGMTDGFFYIAAAAGAPTGTPTAVAGRVPMYYDTTNNKFYIYNGAWKQVALT